MKEKIKELWTIIKDKLRKMYDFVILTPEKSESVFQYILRSMMIPDSSGRSSWSYTLVVYFSVIFGFVYLEETDMAKSIVREYNDSGILIKEYMRGYSTGFWSMIMSLSAAVVFFIKFKGSKNLNQTEEDKKEVDPTKDIAK